MSGQEYPKTARSTVNRYRPRASYDRTTIHTIIDTSPVLHVSFIPVPPSDDPFPAILPMIGCSGAFGTRDDGETQDVYIHGYVSSRLMRMPASAADEDGNGDHSQGTPVCVAATHVDGLVLALTPHDHSNNYRSAVVHGYAHPVTEEAERLYAMELITNNVLAARWENSRVPPTKAELQGTGILRIEVVSASAKVRAGGAGSNRTDLKNEDITSRVWEGVVPSWVQYGEPVAAESNKVANVPSYISEWISEENEKNRGHAVKAAQQTYNKKG